MERPFILFPLVILFILTASGCSGNNPKQPNNQTALNGVERPATTGLITEYIYPAQEKMSYGHEILDYFKVHPKPFRNKYSLLCRHMDLGSFHYNSHVEGSKIRVFKPCEFKDSTLMAIRLDQDHSIFPVSNNGEVQYTIGHINYVLDKKGYPYKSDQSYVDFAAIHLGGGVLERGFVQEEILIMETNLLPFVAALNDENNPNSNTCPRLSLNKLNKEPAVIQGRRFLEIRNAHKIYGNKLSKIDDFSPDKYLNVCPNPTDIYLIAMAAPNFKAPGKEKAYTQADISDMLTLAVRGFYDAMMAQHHDHHPLSIHTGNWGCGAFGNNQQTVWAIQRMALEAAYSLVCKATGQTPPLGFHYHAFDSEGMHRAHEANRAFAGEFPNGLTLDEYSRLLFKKTQVDSAWQVTGNHRQD